VSSYTDCMGNKSQVAFATWCQKKGVQFIKLPFNRKRNRGDDNIKHRYREVYVMKEEYLGNTSLTIFELTKLTFILFIFSIDNVVDAIVKYVPEYQSFMYNLKDEGYDITGYIRKSPGDEVEEKRIELLNRMVECLTERSLTDKVFASPWCLANEPLATRDLTEKAEIIKKLKGVKGNTQGMSIHMHIHSNLPDSKYISLDLFNYLSSTKKDVCLVAIDFAGLSTDHDDIHSFIK
jgi:hypothetical protein